MRDFEASVYRYLRSSDTTIPITVEFRDPGWAVCNGGMVLARDGDWEVEPLPSSRDDAFKQRCRYVSRDEAFDACRALFSPPS